MSPPVIGTDFVLAYLLFFLNCCDCLEVSILIRMAQPGLDHDFLGTGTSEHIVASHFKSYDSLCSFMSEIQSGFYELIQSISLLCGGSWGHNP